ncbi:protein D2-like [Tribolium madens]|uniref:protein D2-like n=1 Tax=Tribolium madens TaxID=41895 RepID=UPI001CF72E5F|nr:protein D2-like [Tribolium madens]
MDTDDLVPSILPSIPSSQITIIYPKKTVDLGQEFAPQDVRDEPQVQWEADPEKYYTLVMTDPDAPSRRCPFVAEVLHWLVGNIKGCDMSTGEVIAEYRGAGPPRGTGWHRYLFMIYEHAQPVTFDEVRMPKEGSRRHRLRFSTENFRKKYNFETIFAWIFFKAQWRADPDARTCVCM